MADDIVYINVEEGSKRVMNNTKLFAKLLLKFKDDPSFNEIEAAFAQKDMTKAQNSTHTLKGLAANLSLAELFKQSQELESQIKAGFLNTDQFAVFKDSYNQTLMELDRVINQYA